ncbi:MAG: DoxX family protein [Filimonas sp.]|nr:DoxX family protein [Filimonas sp.]
MKSKQLLLVVRWFVGLLFIMSGLVKANDPLGLSYKMQEFFEAWGTHAFHDYTLALSIGMNIFEILAGVAVIVGWRMRLFSWLLLLLIIFFTFLTGYAYLSGKFKSCGCFGDCLPLTPLQSFLKDLLLLALILILFVNRFKVKSSLGISVPITLLIVVITAGWLQGYVLQHLPIVDCLPYKKGNNLLEQMKVPPGALPDSFAITFKYKKDGKISEFSMDSLPSEEEGYEYVDRYDKLVRKGNAIPKIEDFALTTQSGNDTLHAVLEQSTGYIMIFVQNFKQWDKAAPAFERTLTAAHNYKLPVFIVTPAPADAAAVLKDKPVTILTCDATVVKTAARVVPTLFLMIGPRVVEKKSYRDVESFVSVVGKMHS